jgi:hypothetical protein
MNIALYIEDGRSQIILTPQSDHEKSLLGQLKDMYENGRGSLTIHRGEFYPCQGGWTRHGTGDESTIIVMDGDA